MGVPIWQTPSGFLGTITERVPVSITLSVLNTGTFSLISGNLPTGLTLSSAGIISGIPASLANTVSTQFVVRATNSFGITDNTFILETQGLNNISWATPAGFINAGVGSEYYVINNNYVNFQFIANLGQVIVQLSTTTSFISNINTLYVNTLTGVDAGQAGIWRTVGGYGIQPGTTITNISTTFNPIYQGYSITLSLPTIAAISTASFITLYDSLPQEQAIQYYIEEGNGQLPPGLTLSNTGLLTGFVKDSLGVDSLISPTGGYDDESYDGYPYDNGVLLNGEYIQVLTRYFPKTYQFSITAAVGSNSSTRSFNIYVVDPTNLLSDTTLSNASGPLAAESGYLVLPTWLIGNQPNNILTINETNINFPIGGLQGAGILKTEFGLNLKTENGLDILI